MDSIDFSEPAWLINYYRFIGTTSLILNSFGVYLIIFKTGRLENFRYYLMFTQIACTLTDLLFTFLMQPIPLYPLFSFSTVGALPSYLNLSHQNLKIFRPSPFLLHYANWKAWLFVLLRSTKQSL
ncbi:hypothetical protein L5515_006012 [Caenorhabditis briggsae]|uniref:Uncharacterized protein n=1 Tax=Caenorhabditis briggsae TaxID=6238 RepID=A0AAE9F3C7_CAEBR|nr:hypothetical protein L5515_006012 [Caenorhabditis briggsae]